MNHNENQYSLQETCNKREEVTSQYKKYYEPVLVGFRGIDAGLVMGSATRIVLQY